MTRLLGRPVRTSPAPGSSWSGLHHGLIKVRLCHARGRSYLLPDEERFFLPSFFGPPKLMFNVPSTGSAFDSRHHELTMDLDVAGPRATVATRVNLNFRTSGLVHSYEDGAQLYRCTYRAPLTSRLSDQIAGKCQSVGNGDFAIGLYHHTTAANAAKIASSAELWSSARNLAGTADLANVSHLYFTTLPSIESEEDLRRVAMSSTSVIHYQTTSDRPREVAVTLPVYEGRLDARGSPLHFMVPLGIVAPAHVLHHPLTRAEPSYYEVVGQEIVRVAVQPGVVGKVVEGAISVANGGLKRFGYVIEGDASGQDGLKDPMREAGFRSIAHIEPLNAALNLFEFWKANANRDLHSGRIVEHRVLRS